MRGGGGWEVGGGERQLIHYLGDLGASLFGFRFFHRKIWFSEVVRYIHREAFQFRYLIVSGHLVGTGIVLQVALRFPRGSPRNESSEVRFLFRRTSLRRHKRRF